MAPLRRRIAAAAVMVVVAAGCSANSGEGGDVTADAGASATPTPAASAAPTATPAPPTATAEPDPPQPTPPATDPSPATDDLEALLAAEVDAYLAEAGVPGLSLAVVGGDGTAISVARGVADIATGEPVHVDDFFRIGSITKSATAAVVLQLVDEGLVGLDDTVTGVVGSWAPGYPYEDIVTIRQLLDHTSGFVEFPFDPGFYLHAAPRLDEPMGPEELLEWAAGRAPLFEPGTARSYTTVGYVAAGLVIEALTGNDAADELRTRVFEPTGAVEVYLPPDDDQPDAAVHGYATGLLATAISGLGVAGDDAAVDFGGDTYLDVTTVPQDLLRTVGWTGGSLEAQLDDTAAMFRGLFTAGVVPDSLLGEMLAPTLDNSYGLGVDVDTIAGVTAYTHGGGVPGFRSQAIYLPDLDMGLAVSANAVPLTPDIGDLTERLVKILAG